MGATAITGKDTFTINGRVLHDFADGDCGKVVYDEDLTKVKAGKDGNVVFALNQGGRVATVTLRIILGSPDDKYLNGLLATYLASPSDYVLDIGSLFKRVGDGAGNPSTVVYQLIQGAPKKQPEAKLNTDGDPNQAVGEWTWIFGNVPRSVI
jgi:hypothetical protein